MQIALIHCIDTLSRLISFKFSRLVAMNYIDENIYWHGTGQISIF